MVLKVRNFWKQFMVSSILPKNEQKITILRIFSLGNKSQKILQKKILQKISHEKFPKNFQKNSKNSPKNFQTISEKNPKILKISNSLHRT